MADVIAEATILVGGKVDPNIGKDTEKSVSGITDALDNVEASSKKAKLGFRDLGKGVADLGDGLVATGIVSQETGDKFALVGDSVAGAKGAFTALKGAASLASSGVGAMIGTLTKFPPVAKAVALGQRLINAAMRANPIGLVITALLLLGAGLVLAYKKSQTFRNIVNAAFNGVKIAARAVFGFITGYIRTQIAIWTAVFNGVKRVLTGIWDGVKAAGTAAFGFLKGGINSVIRGVNTAIDVFNSIPKVPNVRHIPLLASGVRNFRGGLAVVGEAGPEIVNLPAGSDVYSNSASRRMAASGGGDTINNWNFYGPESLSAGRREADWQAKHGTRFGAATWAGAV